MCFAFCDIIMNTLCMTKRLVLLWISPFPEYVEQTFYWHWRIFKQQRHIWGCCILLFWKVFMFERFLPLTEAKKMYVSINGQSPSFLLVRYCCTQTIAGLALYSSLKIILWKVAESEMFVCVRKKDTEVNQHNVYFRPLLLTVI